MLSLNKNNANKIILTLMFILAAVTLGLTYQFIVEQKSQEELQIEVINKLQNQERKQTGIINELENQEKKQIQIWADAITEMYNPNISGERQSSLLERIQNTSHSIQAIVLNHERNYTASSANLLLDKKRIKEDRKYLDSLILTLTNKKDSIIIVAKTQRLDSLGNPVINQNGTFSTIATTNYIYYKNSPLLDSIDSLYNANKQLSASIDEIHEKGRQSSQKFKYLPIVIFIISFFVFLSAYYIFFYSQKSKQNKLWVGMAKETAHQIGTPLSSLIGWLAYFKEKKIEENVLIDIKKDTDRLQQIANRFSKIGSKPTLELMEVAPVLNNVIDYIHKRAPKNIKFKFLYKKEENIKTSICVELFSWVVENILKNAIDSIQTEGEINIHMVKKNKDLILDFCDDGKGILKKDFKNIFEPGYTSKKRGWGLGLSLSKRIITEYHSGSIFVLKSKPYKETIIRIILKT